MAYFDRRLGADIFSLKNLIAAYYECRRNKRRTVNAARFEFRFESELLKLEKELKNRTYRPGRSICFVVTDPKLREIFAADFRDRVVHHLLVGFLEPDWEKRFIAHSFACRQGKGAVKAVKNLQKFIRQATSNGRQTAYYLQADIAGFFTSISRRRLFGLVRSRTKNPDLLWLAEKIIMHNPAENYSVKGDPALLAAVLPHKSLFKNRPGCGLPIGNLTSQFFANVYLNELDQFVKRRLQAKYYLRYVDDILILHADPQQLEEWYARINDFLRTDLELNFQPEKKLIRQISQGVNFTGFIVKPHAIMIRNRTVRRLKNKLWRFNKKILKSYPTHPIRLWTPALAAEFQSILASINSYYGLFCQADTFHLRRHLYEKHFNILKTYLRPADKKYSYFIWDEL